MCREVGEHILQAIDRERRIDVPFIARRKGTDERIDITTLSLPREVLHPGECVCQICGAELLIKGGPMRGHYFANCTACREQEQSHPESRAYREAKRFLATYLPEHCHAYGASLEYDVPLSEIRRVADLVITFPTGWRVAHEVQLAPITSEQLQKRTNDYSLAGIDVVWWLGQSADTAANRAWSREVFGQALSLTLPENSAEHISFTISAAPDSQSNGEDAETLLPSSQLREIFLQRWAYTRRMRNDPRLVHVIKLFANRMRTPCSPSLSHSQTPGFALEEPAPPRALLQLRIVQQIAANPVVQEALHLFAATITDVELVQHVSLPAASPAAVAEPPQQVELFQACDAVELQDTSALALKETIDNLQRQISDLQRQVQRQELEKETLRRQVKRLGGSKLWA